MIIVVDRRESGKTLAAILKVRLGWSWSRVKRMIERRHVRVGQRIETNVARRLKKGQEIHLADTLLLGIASQGRPRLDGSSSSHQGKVRPSSRFPDRPKHELSPSMSKNPKETARNVHDDLSQPPAETAGDVRNRDHSEPKRNLPRISTSSSSDSAAEPALAPVAPHQKPVIDIIYADAAIVVVHKPAGLTTMRHAYEEAEFGERGRRYLPKTLADYLPHLLGSPRRKVYAVHRLDRDTSGLVVFARTAQAAQGLSEQLRRHRIDRRYWALTRGIPCEGRLESWLVRDRGDGRRGSAAAYVAGAKRAITYVRVLERFGQFALVECRLETGRTHQVRIHLGEAGTPLCGERIYDRPLHGRPYPDESGATHLMLHAHTLGFVHPITGEPLQWEAPPPADFLELLERLRRRNDKAEITE